MLQRGIDLILTRFVRRPSNVPVVWHADHLSHTHSCARLRGVLAKVEWHKGESFPRAEPS